MLTLDREVLETVLEALNEQFWASKDRRYLELAEKIEKRIQLLDKLGDE